MATNWLWHGLTPNTPTSQNSTRTYGYRLTVLEELVVNRIRFRGDHVKPYRLHVWDVATQTLLQSYDVDQTEAGAWLEVAIPELTLTAGDYALSYNHDGGLYYHTETHVDLNTITETQFDSRVRFHSGVFASNLDTYPVYSSTTNSFGSVDLGYEPPPAEPVNTISIQTAVYKALAEDTDLGALLAKSHIDPTQPAIYEIWADERADMPYINLSFATNTSNHWAKRETGLEIDIFSNQDSTNAEAIKNRVMKILDRQKISTGTANARVHYDSDALVLEPTPEVSHWTVSFSVYFFRNAETYAD